MTKLEKNLNLIKDVIQTILIPENINKGITIFGVEGSYINTNYTELEYIESSGTQYIDTNIPMSNVSKLVYDLKMTDITTLQNLTGRWSEDLDTIYCFWSANALSFGLRWRSEYQLISADGTQKHNISISTTEIQFDNSIISSYTEAIPGDSDTLQFFCGRKNKGTSGFQNYASIRLYSFKIYNENNILVRDYIPVKDPNGTVCLFDKVSQAYFYNQGAGDFIAGGEV